MRWIGAWLVAGGCVGVLTGTDSGDTAGTPPTEDEVNAVIDAANTCTYPSDCVDLGEQCPFGCWILVNAAEAAAVEAQIDAYLAAGGSTCTYSCSSLGSIDCINGRCEGAP